MSDLTIQKIKERFGVVTDADLARALGVDKSTICSWRRRGVVPKKYLKASPAEPLPSMKEKVVRRTYTLEEISIAFHRALDERGTSTMESFLLNIILLLDGGGEK